MNKGIFGMEKDLCIIPHSLYTSQFPKSLAESLFLFISGFNEELA